LGKDSVMLHSENGRIPSSGRPNLVLGTKRWEDLREEKEWVGKKISGKKRAESQYLKPVKLEKAGVHL